MPLGKKNLDSVSAVSSASEPCIALDSMDVPNRARIVPMVASLGSVAPMSRLKSRTAFSFSSTMATIGPVAMDAHIWLKKERS